MNESSYVCVLFLVRMSLDEVKIVPLGFYSMIILEIKTFSTPRTMIKVATTRSDFTRILLSP